jgi:hypothetical protein
LVSILSFYARRLSSQKEEAGGSKRGDPLDPVIPGAVDSFVLCVVVNLAAKLVVEKSLQLSQGRGPAWSTDSKRTATKEGGGTKCEASLTA